MALTEWDDQQVTGDTMQATEWNDMVTEIKVSNVSILSDHTDVGAVVYSDGKYLRANGSSYAEASITAGDLPTAIDAAKIANGSVSNTEFQYLSTVTSNVQSQIDGKAHGDHNHNHSTLDGTHNLTTDLNRAVSTKTGDYNPAVNRDIILMNGTYTVTLAGSPVLNDVVDVKNIGTGTVTVDGNGNNIDNNSSISLYTMESGSFVFDGSNWWII